MRKLIAATFLTLLSLSAVATPDVHTKKSRSYKTKVSQEILIRTMDSEISEGAAKMLLSQTNKKKKLRKH